MSSPKRIIVFASGDLYKIGGLQRSYAMLTQYLVDVGHTVSVFGWDTGAEGRGLAYPLDEKVGLRLFKSARSKKIADEIAAAVSSFMPDVVLIVNSSHPGLFISLAIRHLGIPIVYSIRGSAEFCLRYLWPCKRILELVFYGANAGHVLMPSYRKLFPPSIREKLEIIPSQIEPAKTFGAPDRPNESGRYVVLYSGRFSFEKRVGLLIKAFSALRDEFPQWDLWLYGDGVELSNAQDLVKELRLEERVVFGTARNTDEMYQVYPKVHLKVLPSEQEGCPMALREAMAHQIPVIAFEECSGSNEIITDGKDGLLISRDADRVNSLAHGMRRLMETPSLRREMGIEARLTADKFHPDEIHSRWERLLVDAAEARGVASSEIRAKYNQEHTLALEELDHLRRNNRYSNVYSFTRDPELFEEHKSDYLLVYGHSLFDKTYYGEEYFDVKMAGIDPLLHYLSVGWRAGHNPSAEFDTVAYRQAYMASDDQQCPLVHYYRYGRFNGARPLPVLETENQEFSQRRLRQGSYALHEDVQIELRILSELQATDL